MESTKLEEYRHLLEKYRHLWRLCTLPCETHSGWQALLERRPDGEAAVVEVADELRVDGAAELSHLPLSRSDEDPLNRLHQDVVEQGVLCT
ncbi:hypothetical protein EYF80_043105 [Liparis tanakae]|uniref:Uncharacterized protein n=1 Tax=Liparis tanakae TaxID=230148 RepID=A0A4Z2FZN3_9TELE|nr:hypothetical protein EYF80_043105 [Liparis tanakae]